MKISYKTITHARTNLLEEAIYSFLNQNWEGESEMIIVNDYPLQKLIFDHPKVKIFNLDKVFPTIGEKENFAVSQCSGDVIIQGDDDDISLNNHFNNINKFFKEDSNILHWSNGCYYNNGEITSLEWVGNSGIVFSKKIWKELGGHPIENAGYDMKFVTKIHNHDKSKVVFAHPPNNEVSWFYRWGGMGYHLSGQGDDKVGKPNIIQRYGEHVENQRKKGLIPTGQLTLQPKWKIDYQKMLVDFNNKNKTNA